MKKILFLFIFANIIYAKDLNYNTYMLKLINITKKIKHDFPFSAMIVDNETGKILCMGTNKNISTNNPSLQSEIVAINSCAKKYKHKINWKNTTLISTAEPCGISLNAALWAGIPKIVYGTSMKFLLKHKWKQIDVSNHKLVNQRIMIIGGIMAKKTNQLYLSFDPKSIIN